MGAHLLTAALFAAATTPAKPSDDSISVAATYCLCVSTLVSHYDEGVTGIRVLGGRAQFEHRAEPGVYIGATAAYETFERLGSQLSMVLPGGTFGIRGGDKLRGGVRLSAGPAYAHDPTPDTSPHLEVNTTRHEFGFFVDTSAEIAVRSKNGIELFLDASIFSYRMFANWSYFSPIVPTMASLGIRFPL